MANFKAIHNKLNSQSSLLYSQNCLFPVEKRAGDIVDLIVDECLLLQFQTTQKQTGNLIVSKFNNDWVRIILYHNNTSSLRMHLCRIVQFGQVAGLAGLFARRVNDYLHDLGFSDQKVYIEQDIINISNYDLIDIIMMFVGCFDYASLIYNKGQDYFQAEGHDPESFKCRPKHKLSSIKYIRSKRLQQCYDIMIDVYLQKY